MLATELVSPLPGSVTGGPVTLASITLPAGTYQLIGKVQGSFPTASGLQPSRATCRLVVDGSTVLDTVVGSGNTPGSPFNLNLLNVYASGSSSTAALDCQMQQSTFLGLVDVTNTVSDYSLVVIPVTP